MGCSPLWGCGPLWGVVRYGVWSVMGLLGCLSVQLAVVALRVTLWESIESKSTFRGEVRGVALVEVFRRVALVEVFDFSVVTMSPCGGSP